MDAVDNDRAARYGLVFAEAAAYGVPSLARATGGIPSVVRNGQNGWAFPMDAAPKAFADYILNEFESPDRYSESAQRARMLFEETLNWNSAIHSLERSVDGASTHIYLLSTSSR